LSDSKISLKIAEKMAEIHSLDIPICKEPEWLWNTMNRWLKNVETILSTSVDGLKNINEKEEAEKLSKLNFRQEVQWLRETIERESMPVIFSHNDLQEGNILLREDCFNDSGSDTYR
jgi:choline/ethanolamine kinase